MTIKLIHDLERLHLGDTWLGHVPAYVGHDTAVDYATKALVEVHDQTTPCHNAIRAYSVAICALQKAMLDPIWRFSDEALLTVALLSFFEKAKGESSESCFSHRAGIEAILISRPATQASTEVTGAILYQTYDRMFCLPVTLGIASPYDQPHLRDMEPTKRYNLTPDFAKLRKISNQLLIRLPRLVACVRLLRSRYTVPRAAHCIALANELLRLKDEEAESSALHRIGVTKTTDASDAAIMAWSFTYRHLGELKAAVLYWETQIFLSGLCRQLHATIPQNTPPFEVETLQAQDIRMVTNILMSWQYAISKGRFGVLGFTQTLIIAVWGALTNVSEFRGMPVEVVRKWILERLPQSIAGWPSTLNAEDMDEAAELFVGGSLKGFMVESYASLLY